MQACVVQDVVLTEVGKGTIMTVVQRLPLFGFEGVCITVF